MTAADDQIRQCIEQGKSFLLDAGAGSGKTYSLVEALKFVVGSKIGQDLAQRSQRVACITFTNVAKDEIIERTARHSLLHVSTIHDFLWSIVSPHQKAMKRALIRHNQDLKPESRRRREPAALQDALGHRSVTYSDRGAEFLEGRIFHDDLLAVGRLLFQDNPMMAKIAAAQFPIIFVDEYQDTSAPVIEILIDRILAGSQGKIIEGFFGDKLQCIYHGGENPGVGEIPQGQRSNLALIQKQENYRCATAVIDVLNRIRTDIKQFPAGDNTAGAVAFVRLSALGAQEDTVEKARAVLKDKLGWSVEGGERKELYLTHKLIARKAGYENLLRVYSDRGGFSRDELVSGEDRIITFLSQKVESLIGAWKAGHTGKVLSILTASGFKLESNQAKASVRVALQTLVDLSEGSTIGKVLQHLAGQRLVELSDELAEELALRGAGISLPEATDESAKARQVFFTTLFAVPYSEVTALCRFLDEHSPFSTKHGVKGAEFDTVFVILDDKGAAWNIYSFDKYLSGEDEQKNPGRMVKTRNLFYVCCSRAKTNLIVVDLGAASPAKDKRVQELFGAQRCIL